MILLNFQGRLTVSVLSVRVHCAGHRRSELSRQHRKHRQVVHSLHSVYTLRYVAGMLAGAFPVFWLWVSLMHKQAEGPRWHVHGATVNSLTIYQTSPAFHPALRGEAHAERGRTL